MVYREEIVCTMTNSHPNRSAQGQLKQVSSKREIKAEEQWYHFCKHNLQHRERKSEKEANAKCSYLAQPWQ